MSNSKIEWTEVTWNPVTGCSKISPGCLNCYAERMSARLKAMNSKNYQNGFEVTCHEHLVEVPLSWKRSKTVFVNSMSDIFHEDIPDEFIARIFRTMNRASQHIFQVLTKRSERLLKMSESLNWTENIWMGVTIESPEYKYRIENLRNCAAKTKFLSIEPLIETIGPIDLKGINWVIVGGESGPRSRPIKEEWVAEIKDQCKGADVPFFFKQWGGTNKKKTGRLLNGRTWDETPTKHKPILSNGIIPRTSSSK